MSIRTVLLALAVACAPATSPAQQPPACANAPVLIYGADVIDVGFDTCGPNTASPVRLFLALNGGAIVGIDGPTFLALQEQYELATSGFAGLIGGRPYGGYGGLPVCAPETVPVFQFGSDVVAAAYDLCGPNTATPVQLFLGFPGGLVVGIDTTTYLVMKEQYGQAMTSLED